MRKDINLKMMILAVAVTSCLTGCKSTGWKMPGSGLFSSNREPDAATLAGKDGIPQLPESPAGKYDPGTIASVGANAKPSYANALNPGAKSPGAKSPSANPYGVSAQTASTPKAGLAATANGYQTGPYQLGSMTKKANSSDIASKASLPSPYGGTYTGTASTKKMPDIALPKSVTNRLANTTAPIGYPAAQSPSSQSPSTQSPSSPSATMGQSNVPVGYPTGNSVPTYPGGSSPGLPSYPSLPSMTSAASETGQPQPSAYKGATTLGATTSAGSSSFAPGTTGRNTKYDFGTKAPTSNTLPPNTASGTAPLMR